MRLRAHVLALGRLQLTGGSLEFLRFADRKQGIEMLLGDGVLIARLRDIHARLIQFLPRQRALIEE